MPALLHDKYILISRPSYDEKFGRWIPYASAGWEGQEFHYRQFYDLSKTFETEEEALSFGFVVARDWIAEERWRYYPCGAFAKSQFGIKRVSIWSVTFNFGTL